MHTIDDSANKIILNHNSDWSGDVLITWWGDSTHKAQPWRECHCDGADLIAGRFTLTAGAEPPIDVITRAVALAVERYLRRTLESAIEDLEDLVPAQDTLRGIEE